MPDFGQLPAAAQTRAQAWVRTKLGQLRGKTRRRLYAGQDLTWGLRSGAKQGDVLTEGTIPYEVVKVTPAAATMTVRRIIHMGGDPTPPDQYLLDEFVLPDGSGSAAVYVGEEQLLALFGDILADEGTKDKAAAMRERSQAQGMGWEPHLDALKQQGVI